MTDTYLKAPETLHPLIGIVGGMGPLASAELIKTIYVESEQELEQRLPRVLLWSDPAVVDRTEAIEAGQLGLLRDALELSIGHLLNAGAETVVIACMTAHTVLPLISSELAARCVSLIDIVFEEVARQPAIHLLLCTRGTTKSGLFTEHTRWAELGNRLVLLSDEDQDLLHRQIYRLKENSARRSAVSFVSDVLLPKYGVPGFVAGCTELHLVTREIQSIGLSSSLPHIDPLDVVAQRIRDGKLWPDSRRS
ncbi:aspartate/glutamate racemase family protein [Kitasatospora sp. NPDC057198]|uniref:aspartate/glutamate racemase family protein n=1 Tax=Kitasatospora sp. NPDC057198 TaxID=3346046 RepID=UPI00364374DB